MGLVVAWLVVADGIVLATRRRPAGDRIAAWLSVASLVVLAGSLAWGLLGDSRHGLPAAAAVPAPVIREETAG
jgi:cytochrome b